MGDGLIVLPSHHGPRETMDRLIAAVTSRGIPIVALVDHAGAAAEAGLALRPTEVLIFGNPKVGTPLMQALPTLALDLPLRVLVWQGDDGETSLAYNDSVGLVRRHGGGASDESVARRLAEVLDAVSKEAVQASA